MPWYVLSFSSTIIIQGYFISDSSNLFVVFMALVVYCFTKVLTLNPIIILFIFCKPFSLHTEDSLTLPLSHELLSSCRICTCFKNSLPIALSLFGKALNISSSIIPPPIISRAFFWLTSQPIAHPPYTSWSYAQPSVSYACGCFLFMIVTLL